MKKTLSLVGALVTVVAAVFASSASIFFIYQPKTPKSMQK